LLWSEQSVWYFSNQITMQGESQAQEVVDGILF